MKKNNNNPPKKQRTPEIPYFYILEIQNTAKVILPRKYTSQLSQIACPGRKGILIIHPETSNFRQWCFLVKSLGRISWKLNISVTTWSDLQFRFVCHKSIKCRKMPAKNYDWSLRILQFKSFHLIKLDTRATCLLRHLLVQDKQHVIMA